MRYNLPIFSFRHVSWFRVHHVYLGMLARQLDIRPTHSGEWRTHWGLEPGLFSGLGPRPFCMLRDTLAAVVGSPREMRRQWAWFADDFKPETDKVAQEL